MEIQQGQGLCDFFVEDFLNRPNRRNNVSNENVSRFPVNLLSSTYSLVKHLPRGSLYDEFPFIIVSYLIFCY